MAEKKTRSISEILSGAGVEYEKPISEILSEVKDNTVPSVEEKIKDSSTSEFNIEEKKDYSKSKVLNNNEVSFINKIKNDKQRNDILRLKDILETTLKLFQNI